MKPFFGYIRVSTVKQGQQGVSLQEQSDAILRHAGKSGLEIIQWFEEQETAAKRGRPVFNRMLKLLRQGKAKGVVLHKIDRGARNLKDWADLAELNDAGIEIHFANEGLDLNSRGGRLSADIQAVVAADFIRNLREETRKGFYGRLKQGVYPLPAPLGYLDRGKGKPKEIDPVLGPLVRKAYELYCSGRFSLDTLGPELYRLGLRNKHRGRVTRNGLSRLLKNPYYIGIIRLVKTSENFPGIHTPLVPKSLFDRAQQLLTGRAKICVQKHDFRFRRLLSCKSCRLFLTGERQKGHNYYRCHTADCPTACIREEAVEQEIERQISPLQFNDQERAYCQAKILKFKADWVGQEEAIRASMKLRLGQIQDRLSRLTDAFLDGAIDRIAFERRKAALLMEEKTLEEEMAGAGEESRSLQNHLSEIFELAGNAWLSYRMGLPEERRDLLRRVTSNREVEGKNVVVKLSFPFCDIANRLKSDCSDPHRARLRTLDEIFDLLVQNSSSGMRPTNLKP